MSKKTEVLKFVGPCDWIKVEESTRDMYEFNEETQRFDKPSSCEGVYSISMTLTPEDYKRLKQSGSMAAKHSKLNEAGEDVVRFRRQHVKYGRDGKVLEWASGAPKVEHPSGDPWDFEKEGNLGNGTLLEAHVSVYPTRFNPGTRLEKIVVLNQVEYVPENKDEQEEEKEKSFVD